MYAILDGGCNRSCHGQEWLIENEHKLTAGGQRPLRRREVPLRHFAGVGSSAAKCRWIVAIPLALELANGQVVAASLESAENEGSSAPLLLSLPAQRQLGIVRWVGDQRVHYQAFGQDGRVTAMPNRLHGLAIESPWLD